MYQDLSTCYDWPVKKAIVDLPIKMKGNSNFTSGNSLSSLGAQNKDISAALRTLLADVKLRLRHRLSFENNFHFPSLPVKMLDFNPFTIRS